MGPRHPCFPRGGTSCKLQGGSSEGCPGPADGAGSGPSGHEGDWTGPAKGSEGEGGDPVKLAGWVNALLDVFMISPDPRTSCRDQVSLFYCSISYAHNFSLTFALFLGTKKNKTVSLETELPELSEITVEDTDSKNKLKNPVSSLATLPLRPGYFF